MNMSTVLDYMSDIVDEARRHTDSNVIKTSNSQLPKFIDLNYNIIRNGKYRYDGNIVTDNEHIIIKVDNVKVRSSYISTKKDFTFNMSLEDAVKDKIFPIILFIDGKHVRWFNIRLVNDTRYMYLLINKRPFDERPIVIKDIKRIDCLQLPFNVYYVEDRSNPPNNRYKELLRFSLDGEYVDIGKVIYYIDEKNISMSSYIFPNGNINGYDLKVDHRYRLSRDNVLLFRNRLLDRDSRCEVNRLNMLYVKGDESVKYKAKCIYRTDTDSPYNIISRFPNVELAKEIAYNTIDNERINTDIVNTDFDFTNRLNVSREDNIKNNFKYITSYDGKYIADVYSKFSTIECKVYTGKEIASKLKNSILTMALLDYKDNDTKVMVFCNGEIYKNYSLLKYNLNEFSMLVDTSTLNNRDVFEIVFIKNVNNYSEKIIYTKGNRYKTQKMFSDDELLLYSNNPKGHKYLKHRQMNERSWYPVEYTIKNGDVIVDDYYVNQELYYTTKNQFKYHHRYIQKETMKIRLSGELMLSLNPNQYLIFLNGRLMNREFYRLTVPSVDNVFTELYLYSRIKFKKGDKIEVFYMPVEFNPIDYANNLVTKVSSIDITYRTRDAVIVPYPFNLYTKRHDFILFKNSVYVDPNRYEVKQGMLYFTDGTIYNQGDKLVFVFVYNRCKDQEAYHYINNDSSVFVEQIQLRVDEDNQTSFTLDEERYLKYLIEGNSIMLLYHGMHIPSEYWKLNRFTGEITFAPNSFKIDDYITVVIYHLSDKAMKIGNSIFDNSVEIRDIPENFPIEEFNKALTDDILILGKDGIADKLLPDGKSVALTGDAIVTKEDIDNLIGDNKFDKGLNKVEIKFTAIKDYQYDFDVSKISVLPQSNIKDFTIVDEYFNIDEYLTKGCPVFIIRNGVLQAEGYHYTILRKDNKISFVKPFMDDEEFYLITYTSPGRSVRLYEHDILIEDSNKLVYNIKDRFGQLDQTKYRFVIYIGSLVLDSRRYDIDSNYNLTFIDNTMFEIGQHIRIFALYITTDTNEIFEYNHLGSTKYHSITHVDVNFIKNKYIYDIPYPNNDTDTGFLIFCGGILIEPSRYAINYNTKTIRFLDKQDLMFKENTGFKVVFIYDRMKTISISSAESETISRVLNTYKIPVPFSNYFKLNNSVLVFSGGTIMDSKYYSIDMNNSTITLSSTAGLEGRVLRFMFIYQNSYKNIGYTNDDVTISNIRKSGYIFVSKDVLEHPLDKRLFWTFVNGKKIPISNITDISMNLVRINKDPQSRHNLVLLSHTRRIEELDEYFSVYSNYDTLVNNLDCEDIDRLYNEFRVLSDTEVYHEMNITKEALVSEIVRDWYGRTGYYNGDKFVKSYVDFTEASDVQVDLGTGEKHSMVLDGSKYYSSMLDRSNTNYIDEE